ncbi:hypothetical protein COLSTE_00070 [Collinsella stercoris DSM 13279]|uniref:Uncharacterized protein n=1 Tax=Collinsella stercoris DSM 13279 TaxID=445975 RepID=B6G7N0_9ACTN|nr:hypothetical protein COLSTE_00070 [Collinsella stercoris DSM 13279]
MPIQTKSILNEAEMSPSRRGTGYGKRRAGTVAVTNEVGQKWAEARKRNPSRTGADPSMAWVEAARA